MRIRRAALDPIFSFPQERGSPGKSFDKSGKNPYKTLRRTKSEYPRRRKCSLPWSASSLRLHVESALSGRVVAPFRFREAAAPAVVPAGIAALDELTGGLPRGCLTEICGPPGSGKSSIL